MNIGDAHQFDSHCLIPKDPCYFLKQYKTSMSLYIKIYILSLVNIAALTRFIGHINTEYILSPSTEKVNEIVSIYSAHWSSGRLFSLDIKYHLLWNN